MNSGSSGMLSSRSGVGVGVARSPGEALSALSAGVGTGVGAGSGAPQAANRPSASAAQSRAASIFFMAFPFCRPQSTEAQNSILQTLSSSLKMKRVIVQPSLTEMQGPPRLASCASQ